jgi:hypothetical protein
LLTFGASQRTGEYSLEIDDVGSYPGQPALRKPSTICS